MGIESVVDYVKILAEYNLEVCSQICQSGYLHHLGGHGAAGGEDPGRQPDGVCHQTQSKRQQYHGAKCTLIDSLVQFDYTLKGHSQV